MFHKVYSYFLIAMPFLALPITANAEVIDPEVYIQNHGYQSERMGDNGKTVFYSASKRVSSENLVPLKNDIAQLPKHPKLLTMCDFIRGLVKATLIEKQKRAIDVAVANYGYKGSTIACTLKYMLEDKVGTQLVYLKEGVGKIYIVIIVN